MRASHRSMRLCALMRTYVHFCALMRRALPGSPYIRIQKQDAMNIHAVVRKAACRWAKQNLMAGMAVREGSAETEDKTAVCAAESLIKTPVSVPFLHFSQ